MIKIEKKEDCCGCFGCVNECPIGCVSLKNDSEGFPYPFIDEDKCINCGMCNKVCPILNPPIIDSNEKPKAFVVQNIDEVVRKDSSSGGIFSLLANYVLKRNGYVFGVAYDDNWNVKHISVNSVDELGKLRGSKYVQSNLDLAYREVKALLQKNIWVCFSGTPCQIAALKNYLKKDYSTLLIVDIICHGVPSQKVWRKYLDFHINKYGPIDKIFFRSKEFGFAGSTMALFYKSGKKLYMGQELQFHKACFFKDLSTRPSCYECKFKTAKRVSDFTLFDCWHINVFNANMDDDKGTSGVLIHSERGLHILNELKKEALCQEVNFEELIRLDGSMLLKSIKYNNKRTDFFSDLDRMTVPVLIRKYTPFTLKKRLIQMVKPTLSRLGILNKLKRKMKGLI